MKFKVHIFRNVLVIKWLALVITCGVTFMIFELSHAAGAFWTNPDSIYSIGPSYSPMNLWLFQNLLTIGKKLNPLHPHAVYQLIIAAWSALTGLIVFEWSWKLSECASPVKRSLVSLLVSFTFSFNPLIWQAAAEGQILLIQTGFLAFILYLWNVPGRKSRLCLWTGMFLFGLILPMSPHILPLAIIPLLQTLSVPFSQKPESGQTALSPVLLAVAGIFPVVCFTFFKPDFLSLQWLNLNALHHMNKFPPMRLRSGFKFVLDLLKGSIGLTGLLILLVFPYIRFRFFKGRGVPIYWLTFFFTAVMLSVIWPNFLGSDRLDSIVPFLTPLYLLLIPVYTSVAGAAARYIQPRFLMAAGLVIVLILLSKWSVIDLSGDYSYQDLIEIYEPYKSRSPGDIRFINHCFLNAEKTNFTYEDNGFEFGLPGKTTASFSQGHQLAEEWNRSIYSRFRPNPSVKAGFHQISAEYVSSLWGEVGTFWLYQYLFPENESRKKEASVLAFLAYRYALNLAGENTREAAFYSDAIALFLFDKQNYEHFLTYSTLSTQLSATHLESRIRLYRIARHTNSQREMLRLLNQIILIQPENLGMQMELAQVFADLGYGHRARIVYDLAVKAGAKRREKLEMQLAPLRRSFWTPRNLMVIPHR